MKRIKCILSGAVGLALIVTILPMAVFAASELVPLYTPPVGGTAYVLGAGVVSVTNKYIPNANLVHEATTGTLDMVRRMIQREAAKKPCFGIFGTPDGWKAFKGEADFGGKPFSSLRSVVFVNASDMYLVVPAKSPIKSFSDVKGKRVGIGGPGSTVANSALLFLEYSGVARYAPGCSNFNQIRCLPCTCAPADGMKRRDYRKRPFSMPLPPKRSNELAG